jgi:hypothetical protein
MQEKSRRPGTGQRSGDFFTDDTRFAHAGNDDLAGTNQYRLDRLVEIVGQQVAQVANGVRLGVERIDRILLDLTHIRIVFHNKFGRLCNESPSYQKVPIRP